ncbi:MAG: LytTR family transcriptional regulator [Clostridia bacterium]|nr:LytTR family transcriptional regulator [Clostridia bacterium]
MDVEIRIDKEARTPKVIIVTDRMSEDVSKLVSAISDFQDGIPGSRGGVVRLLEPEEILRIYTSGRHVVASTCDGEYVLRLRLYELEERLQSRRFVRISNSEIVNLRHVRHFDVSRAGVFCAVLDDGTTTFVSRRYIGAIRKLLGI